MRWLITILAYVVACQFASAHDPIADRRPLILPDTLQAYVGPDQKTYLYFFTTGTENLEQIVSLFELDRTGIKFLRRIGTSDNGEFKGIVLAPFRNSLLVQNPSAGAHWIPVVYVVRPRETVFRIARRFFNMPVDDLLTLNNLPSTDLRTGQRLSIGWIAARNTLSESHTAEVTDEASEYAEHYFAHRPTIESYGVAIWDKGIPPDSTQMFAMHRSAQLNSYIEVTNPMFGRSVMAKVVGRIPQTSREDVSIILSPAVAQELYALDARFRVRLRYIE